MVPTLVKQKQVDLHEFEVSLVYTGQANQGYIVTPCLKKKVLQIKKNILSAL